MSHRVSTLVAGVGTLSERDPAFAAALNLARRTGATLHLVHAFEFPPILTLEPGAETLFPETATRLGNELRAEFESVVRGIKGGERAVCHTVPGSPAEAIRRTAAREGAELVMVGASTGNRLGQAILGTTAQRVLREVEVPVLVARSDLSERPRRVMLTTDLSGTSASVHEAALDLLEAVDGAALPTLRSVMVVAFGLVPPPLSAVSLHEAATRELDAFLRERRPRDAAVEGVVRTGAPAAEIVTAAREWDADLLVVGTHARHGFERMVLGSVAEACIRDAPCDVLAIPPHPRDARAREAERAAAGSASR